MIKEIEFKRPTSSSDETRLTRYGLPWTTNELLDLEFYWREGDYVEDISKKMQPLLFTGSVNVLFLKMQKWMR